MDLEDANVLDIEPDWKKIKRDMTKIGLKNGLSDGRDSNFQRSFDTGYNDGFQNGYELGKIQFQCNNYKGLVSSLTSEFVQNSSKGMCILCISERDNEDVSDVRKKQTELFKENMNKIKQDLQRQS